MFFFFVFKQKTAYELRISDWSSDVCSSDLFGDHRQRPIGEAEGAADAVDDHIALHQRGVGSVADEGEPAVREHHRVEFVAVDDEQFAPVGGFVDRLAADFDPAEIETVEGLHHLVMVAGRSEEHTSELQSLMRNTYAVFCSKKKKKTQI